MFSFWQVCVEPICYLMALFWLMNLYEVFWYQICKDTFSLNHILLKLIRLWMLFEIFIYNYHLTLKYISNAVIVSIQFL